MPTIFSLKNFYLSHIRTGLNGFSNFFVFSKIFAKNVCPVVVDYADTASAIVSGADPASSTTVLMHCRIIVCVIL